jgi:hypothetical protein
MTLIGFRIKTPEEMDRDIEEWKKKGAPPEEQPDALVVNDADAHRRFVRQLLNIIESSAVR